VYVSIQILMNALITMEVVLTPAEILLDLTTVNAIGDMNCFQIGIVVKVRQCRFLMIKLIQ